jgi:hypothetical protein
MNLAQMILVSFLAAPLMGAGQVAVQPSSPAEPTAVPFAAPPLIGTWTNHAPPFTFLFGNHIDTHQQTIPLPNGGLIGFLYITYTGETTASGLPVAKHPDENTPASEIVIGWVLRAKPGKAVFVHHDMDHPLWLVESRTEIPQPGGFSHFHWLGGPEHAHELVMEQEYSGYFLELTALKKFAFDHGGEQIPVSPGLDLATHLNIVASFPMGCGGHGG